MAITGIMAMMAMAGLEEMELEAWTRALLHGARALAILAAGAGAYFTEKREQEKWEDEK